MHLYLLTRGTLRAIREWREALSNCYLPLEVKNKDGKKENAVAQLQVRPVELYEIVFPEEHEETVMGMVKCGVDLGCFGKKWAKYLKFITKRLGLNPPLKKWKPQLLPPNSGVTALALGTKKDKVNWTKKPSPNSLLDKGSIPRENI